MNHINKYYSFHSNNIVILNLRSKLCMVQDHRDKPLNLSFETNFFNELIDYFNIFGFSFIAAYTFLTIPCFPFCLSFEIQKSRFGYGKHQSLIITLHKTTEVVRHIVSFYTCIYIANCRLFVERIEVQQIVVTRGRVQVLHFVNCFFKRLQEHC